MERTSSGQGDTGPGSTGEQKHGHDRAPWPGNAAASIGRADNRTRDARTRSSRRNTAQPLPTTARASPRTLPTQPSSVFAYRSSLIPPQARPPKTYLSHRPCGGGDIRACCFSACLQGRANRCQRQRRTNRQCPQNRFRPGGLTPRGNGSWRAATPQREAGARRGASARRSSG
jgi:hypothetical protein